MIMTTCWRVPAPPRLRSTGKRSGFWELRAERSRDSGEIGSAADTIVLLGRNASGLDNSAQNDRRRSSGSRPNCPWRGPTGAFTPGALFGPELAVEVGEEFVLESAFAGE
jgi:hypothetical protein